MKRKMTAVITGMLLPALGAIASRAADLRMFEGRPAFREGFDRGYFVWKEGDEWHLRWTTTGKLLRFSGSVIAEGGKLKSLKRVDVEKERRVIRSGTPPRVAVGPRGRVRVAPGRPPVIVERRPDGIEKEDDHTIRFVAHTDDDIDGFDFKVGKEVQLLRFRLEIEGRSRASEVEIGSSNTHPREDPFVVNLR